MHVTLKRSGSVVLVALIALMAALGLIASYHVGHSAPQQPLRPGNSLHLGDRSIAGDSIAGD
jgi:hypothetical protein